MYLKIGVTAFIGLLIVFLGFKYTGEETPNIHFYRRYNKYEDMIKYNIEKCLNSTQFGFFVKSERYKKIMDRKILIEKFIFEENQEAYDSDEIDFGNETISDNMCIINPNSIIEHIFSKFTSEILLSKIEGDILEEEVFLSELYDKTDIKNKLFFYSLKKSFALRLNNEECNLFLNEFWHEVLFDIVISKVSSRRSFYK